MKSINYKDGLIGRLELQEPLAEVEPGEIFRVSTLNAFGFDPSSEGDFREKVDQPRKSHLLTGPIWVRGADENSSLAIHVLKLETESILRCISRSTGLLRGRFLDRDVHLDDVTSELDEEGVLIKGRASIGTIGTLDEVSRSPGRCSENGGNLDIPTLREGSVVYLPVNHSSGMFAVGDVHFRQGMGEISGMGYEANGKMDLLVQVCEKVPYPVVDNGRLVTIVGWGESAQLAQVCAVENTMHYLASRKPFDGWSASRLYQFLGSQDLVIGNLTGKVATMGVALDRRALLDPVSRQHFLMRPEVKIHNRETSKYADILDAAVLDDLPLLVEGNSKSLHSLPGDPDRIIGKLKPQIYSLREGGYLEVPEDITKLRADIHRFFADLLHSNGILTSTLAVKDDRILMQKTGMAPIEVVVKRSFKGSAAHEYEKIDSTPRRAGAPFQKGQIHEPYVRFDWRVAPPGFDKVMPDELANQFVNTENARATAFQAFALIESALREVGIQPFGACFFMNESGNIICSEVSPDCFRSSYEGDDSTLKAVFADTSDKGKIDRIRAIHSLIFPKK